MKNNSKFFLFILLLILVKSQDSNSSDSQQNPGFFDLAVNIFKRLENECFTEIYEVLGQIHFNEKDKKYPWLTDYLGKGFNNLGDEIECLNSIKDNTTFILINFYNLELGDILQADRPLLEYLEIKNFTFGFCLMQICSGAFRKYIRLLAESMNYIFAGKIANESLVTYIESNKNISDKSNVKNQDDLETFGLKIFFIVLFVGMGIFKLLGSFVRIIKIPKGYDKYAVENMNKMNKLNNKENTNSDIEEKSTFISKNKYDEALNEEMNVREYNPLYDFSEKLPKKVRILRFFDIINDFQYLSLKRNRYFNDSGLDILNFFRAMTIFALIFSNTFSALIKLPSEEIINKNFFKHWMNIFYRLSNNALTTWIFLEAAYTTYKLLCLITTEMFFCYTKEDRRSVKLHFKLLIIYGKFFILLIPRMLIFVLMYYILYYRIEDYRFANSSPAYFKYVIEYIFKEGIKCEKILSKENFAFSTHIEDYDTCYEFVYFYINMILSIFIFMIITYLFFVIRNKIFEIVMMGVNFAFFLFSIFIVNDTRIKDSEILKHYHLIGQTYSTKILYSFLGFYHLGFVFGFILFNFDNLKPKIKRLLYEYSGYHSPQGKNKIENVRPSFMSESRDTMTDMESNFTSRTQSMMSSSFYKYDEDSPDYYKNFILPYYPLKYINRILYPIYKLKFSRKILIILGCIFLLFLIDFILLISVMTSKKFDIKLNNGHIFMFLYEKQLYMIVYFVMSIVVITLPKKCTLRTFMQSRFFIITSRMGFFITCIVEAFTYLSSLVFSIKVKLYVPTLAIISFGNFLQAFIFCFLFIVSTELPLRMLIKKLLRINRNKENINL